MLCGFVENHTFSVEQFTIFRSNFNILPMTHLWLLRSFYISELKRRMKAEKKAAEKEAKVKEQVEQKKESNDQGVQQACEDEETLDPNVRFSIWSLFITYYCLWNQCFGQCLVLYLFPSHIAILQDPLPGHPRTEGHSTGPVPTQVSCRLVPHRVPREI